MNDFAKLMLASIVVMVLHVQNLFAANVTYNSEFFSNLYLKFLRHRFGLGRAATFGGDGLFL